MSKLFRTKDCLTIAQLTGAWSPELVEGGEDPKQCEQNLIHILLEDILTGRLDDSGPPRDDGQRLGLRLITPKYEPGFIKGSQLLELIQTDRSRVLHSVVVMKGAVLDFAQRHELPSPSWWAVSARIPAEVPTDTAVNVVKPNTGAPASRSMGKQPRILRYLSKHFADGVPDPGLCPRYALKSDILEWDASLDPLDEATLKKAIEKHNASLSKQNLIRNDPIRTESGRFG
jgi:hypothetical protein